MGGFRREGGKIWFIFRYFFLGFFFDFFLGSGVEILYSLVIFG